MEKVVWPSEPAKPITTVEDFLKKGTEKANKKSNMKKRIGLIIKDIGICGMPPVGFAELMGYKQEARVFQAQDAKISYIEPKAFKELDTRRPLTPRLIVDGRVWHTKIKHKTLRVKIHRPGFARPVYYSMEVPRDFTADQRQSLANYIKMIYYHGIPFKFNF